MKENVKLIEENVEYTRLNGRRSKYNVYEANGVKVTVDHNESVWEEKYRPRKTFDLIVTDELKSKLDEWISKKDIPDLILYSIKGGTGKTSISQVLISELGFDSLSIPCNITRGLDVIKNEVTQFSQTLSTYGDKKIVSFEEIGDMTTVAVDSLKSIKDRFSTNIHMIITTNSLSNISEPLKTRFYTIDFNKFSDEEKKVLEQKQALRFKIILDIEGIEYTSESFKLMFNNFKLNYRQLLENAKACVINNELKPDIVGNTNEDYQNILNMINENDMVGLIKISDRLNHIDFFNYIKSNYLHLLSDIKMIPSFIMILQKFQEFIHMNLLSIGVAFLDICRIMIQQKIVFKINN